MADSDSCEHNFGPWFKSPPGYFFLLIFMLLLFQQSLHKENLIYDFKTVTYNFPLLGLRSS